MGEVDVEWGGGQFYSVKVEELQMVRSGVEFIRLGVGRQVVGVRIEMEMVVFFYCFRRLLRIFMWLIC